MSEPIDPAALGAAFFGASNGFRWDGPHQARLRAWADDARHPTRAVFLPRKLADGRVRWYALARTARQARDLRDQLSAFLGRGYTDFDGRAAEFSAADPVEAALAGRFGRAAELLDRLAEHGVHQHAPVEPLVQPIVTAFGLAPGRVTDGQWALLERACSDFGLSELCAAARLKPTPAPGIEDEETRFRRQLDGKTVVLHTLLPTIAAAFLRAVEFKFRKTRFTVLREMDESKRLKDVAQNADVYIVNTFDLPHMASGPVKKYRSEANTLYPAGKNADQQVEALYRWLRTGATSPLVED